MESENEKVNCGEAGVGEEEGEWEVSGECAES